MSKLSDCWQTPDALFEELNAEFHFNIDLCATKENSKCGVAFCKDYLKDQMSDEGGTHSSLTLLVKLGDIKTAFMNPPYSNPKPFIQKAWEDSKHCKIVCLVKCDPSTQWWATFWQYVPNIPEGYRGPNPGCEVRFFPKRIKFVAPEGLDGSSGPTFPCALVIMDRRGL